MSVSEPLVRASSAAPVWSQAANASAAPRPAVAPRVAGVAAAYEPGSQAERSPTPLSPQSLSGLQSPGRQAPLIKLAANTGGPRADVVSNTVVAPPTLPNATLTPVEWSSLPGWAADDHAAAYKTFLASCQSVITGGPKKQATPPTQALKDVCQRALQTGPLNAAQARAFFEQSFRPMQINATNATAGLITGFYVPVVAGSRVKTDEFKYPLYALPGNAADRSRSRAEIEGGALDNKGLELVYLKDPIDSFFAHVQGSVRIALPNGQQVKLETAAKNGLPYTSVGRVLVDRKLYTTEEMSMDVVRNWMTANPDQAIELRRQNASFVYFKELPMKSSDQALGAQGMSLKPERSIAIDSSIHPYGTPIFINASLPIASDQPTTPFNRLMIAQDRGDAIKGPARADIYWGVGDDAAKVAGRFNQHGSFTMLVPR